MSNYKKEYTDRKIAKCKELVENATSDAQREIYRGYLEFWTRHAKKDDIAEELEEPTIIEEPVELNTETMGDVWNTVNEAIDIISLEANFKLKYPNKQAYYNRDGKTHLTKAFKEYLNQRTK